MADATYPVTAQMAASVAAVPVAAGAVVAAGDTLLVVESMKMEIPVTAPEPGTVAEVHVGPGDLVQEGDLLVTLSPAGP